MIPPTSSITDTDDLGIVTETLLNQLLHTATYGAGSGDDDAYKKIRHRLLADPRAKTKVPRFLQVCGNLREFWAYMKDLSPTYHGRRSFLSAEMRPLIDFLDGVNQGTLPTDKVVSDALTKFDQEGVSRVWDRILERRKSDPGGAITAARTLVESVCKHILDAAGIKYDNGADLPNLYGLLAKTLKLSPHLQVDNSLRQTMSGCISIINGLAALRNQIGDAHGPGVTAPTATEDEATLAINVAAAACLFLIAASDRAKVSIKPAS